MKFIKETYRDFKKSLLIYMAGEPTMEYQGKLEKAGRGVQDVKSSYAEESELLKGQQFNEKKDQAQKLIKKIDLDANPGLKTEVEKKLEDDLTAHNNKQFNLLEHNYQRAVLDLGESRKNQESGLVKAEAILRESTNKYIGELQVHIFKENVKGGSEEAKGLMIEQFLQSKGIALKGIGKYLAQAIVEKGKLGQLEAEDLKTKEGIDKKLEEIIDDKEVLQLMVEKMSGETELPTFEMKDGEKAYFHSQIELSDTKDGKDRLARYFGNDNKGYVEQVLSMRFHIDFAKGDSNKPNLITDVTTNKTYKADSAEWRDKLRSICHSMKDFDDVKKNDEGMYQLRNKREANLNELKEGTLGPDWEVHKLGRLKDNPLLTEVLQATVAYREATGREFKDFSDQLRGIPTNKCNKDKRQAFDSLISTITPEKAKDTGLFGALGELITMIKEALGIKDTEKSKAALGEMQKDIDENNNPVTEQKKAAELFDKVLKSKPESTLEELIDPNKVGDYFHTRAIGLVGATEADKYSSRYPEKRTKMVAEYLAGKLGFNGISITPTDNGYTLGVRQKENRKTYEIEKKDDKYTIKLLPKGVPQDFEFTVDGLKQFLANPTDKKAEKKEKAPEKTDEEYAKEALVQMVSDNPKGTSDLGKLIGELKLDSDFQKESGKKKFKEWGGDTPAEKQKSLDKARADFLSKRIDVTDTTKITVDALKKNKDFTAKFVEAKKPKTAPAEVSVTPVVATAKEESKDETKDPDKKPDITSAEKSLKDMISSDPRGTSPLGQKMVELGLDAEFKKGPGKKKFKEWEGDTPAEKQKSLDTARAEFILSKLKSDPIKLQALKSKLESAATQPPAPDQEQSPVQADAPAPTLNTSASGISASAEKKVIPIPPKTSESDTVTAEKTPVQIEFTKYLEASAQWKFTGGYSTELNTNENRKILAKALKDASYQPNIPVSISANEGISGPNLTISINRRELKATGVKGSNPQELFKKAVEKIKA